MPAFPAVKPGKSGIKIDFDRALDTKVHELKRGVDFGTAAYIAREALRQDGEEARPQGSRRDRR
jgi:hypothetical protein